MSCDGRDGVDGDEPVIRVPREVDEGEESVLATRSEAQGVGERTTHFRAVMTSDAGPLPKTPPAPIGTCSLDALQLPADRPASRAISVTSSAGATGLATCASNPAAMALMRSLSPP